MINKIKHLINNKPFLKNTSVLASGILISQIISIVFSPLLSRIYTPIDFGLLHIFLSFISILTIIATLKFEMAIPLPSDDKIAIHLVISSIIFITFFTLIIGINLYIFKPFLIKIFDLQQIANHLYLIPLGTFFAAFYLILNYWAIRKKKFNTISKTKIKQGALGIVIQIGLGLIGLKPLGLLIGSIFKRAAGFYELLKIVLQDKKLLKENFNLEKIISSIKRYKKFPLVSSQSALINTVGLNLPILLFANFYGSEKVGFFSLVLMVVNIPLTTIGISLSQVFISETSELINKDKKQLKKLYYRIVKNLFLIGFIPCLVLLIWSPKLFPVIFGEKWIISGEIAQILAIMFLIQFTVVPTSQMLTILEKQEIQFIWDLLRLITVYLSIYLPYFKGSTFLITIYYYGFSMSIMYLLLVILHIIKLNEIITDHGQ